MYTQIALIQNNLNLATMERVVTDKLEVSNPFTISSIFYHKSKSVMGASLGIVPSESKLDSFSKAELWCAAFITIYVLCSSALFCCVFYPSKNSA